MSDAEKLKGTPMIADATPMAADRCVMGRFNERGTISVRDTKDLVAFALSAAIGVASAIIGVIRGFPMSLA